MAKEGISYVERKVDRELIFWCLTFLATVCSFGEPIKVGGYPTMKLNWFRTRRVVKWSRVVRQEKAALHYGVTSLPATHAGRDADLVESESDDEDDDQFETSSKIPRYHDKEVRRTKNVWFLF
jgi:hypothetical protein